MKESRLFRILYYLLQNGRTTAPELARELEVSVRTIYRDIDSISSAGIPIYESALLEYCIRDARAQGKAGVCILTSKKKQPFLSDKKFLQKCGFEVVDRAGDGYELMALSFHGEPPRFSESARQMKIHNKELTIYYGMQCPYISDCVKQVRQYCNQNSIPVNLVAVDTLEKAKNLPCIFSNWAVFRDGVFITNHLLNETYMKKKLGL